MIDVDSKIELDFVEKRLVKLQQALLQMRIDEKSLAKQIHSVEAEVGELKGLKVRLKAIEEEAVGVEKAQ